VSDSSDTTLILVPGDGGESKRYRFSPGRVRLLKRAAWVAGVVGAMLVVSWGFLFARSLRVAELESRVAALEGDLAQTRDLAATLEALEARYAQLQGLFGADVGGVDSDVWLPPPAGTRGSTSAVDRDDPTPTSWPLTERGFVTQTLLEGADATGHPGLDIAVPADSYVRASGAGTVAEVGEDPVYGRYIVLDHGNGYRTRYAHANIVFAEEGAVVRRNEVIALSGNTGRSTAPHLHFEILLDGEAVDPLSLVQQPA